MEHPAGEVAVGTATSIGTPTSSIAGVYNPVTVGTTTVTIGNTAVGAAAVSAIEGILAAKIFLDAGVYLGAVVVCSVE